MARQAIPVIISDISEFARAIRAETPKDESGHQTWLNRIARAAGYRNFQHLSALQKDAEPLADQAKVRKALRRFDSFGRFASWPARRAQRDLCMWAVWARLPSATTWNEREISQLIDSFTGLKDSAQIRRALVEMDLLKRNRDGTGYIRLERRPPPEARALITALGDKSRV